MVNIAVLLRECPKGMELDSTICNDLYFDFVDDWDNIHCFIQRKNYRTSVLFYPDGTLTNDPRDKCVIFPKGKTTWEGFQRPFKDGDILSTVTGGVFILKSYPSDDLYYHCYVGLTGCGEFQKEQMPFSYKQFCTRASEIEKQKLFDAIKENGYKWYPKTKILEKWCPFNPGDVLVSGSGNIVLFSHINDRQVVYYHCILYPVGDMNIVEGTSYGVGKVHNCKLATEEQRKRLFNKLQMSGYKYNPQTNKLEKLVEPRFKDGDVCYLKTKTLFEFIFILKVGEDCNYIQRYVSLAGNVLHTLDKGYVCPTDNVKEMRLATEGEKQRLFDTIKARSYRWNVENKALEELKFLEFKEGDIAVSTCGDIHLLRTADSSYCSYRVSWSWEKSPVLDKSLTTNIAVARLATKEEKEKLFDLIKANNYRWNSKTKILEKLVESNFKVGDRVKHKEGYFSGVVTEINDEFYCIKYDDIDFVFFVDIKCQDDWELVSDKFNSNSLKPFESRVLVRNGNATPWIGGFYSHFDKNSYSPFYCTGNVRGFRQCIPFEGNEHLLGKTDDCPPFFKIWE